MSDVKRPDILPDCNIINELIRKYNTLNNNNINYISELEGLVKLVKTETSQINLAFPEYTPHDKENHLDRLCIFTDKFLGEELISKMKATELFLLCVAIYAHDWGMAVGGMEKELIRKGEEKEEIALLDDENERFGDFCEEMGIDPAEPDNVKDFHWQEYIRRTHAYRSGSRVQNHFSKKDQSIAEYANNICCGHWFDFSKIECDVTFPTDIEVNNENVNIKALAIYIRLIDLLDISEARTPYVLWKYLSPKNEKSKEEWEKHRAIYSVGFTRQAGKHRKIAVTGSTPDHIVYMKILDMKEYIDDQFRQSCDILHRFNHEYHFLNISNIDWTKFKAKGFVPVPVKFEFDRPRMFEILSEQIYDGNPYVFIRELIQNAIDAISMHEEISVQNGKILQAPEIKVTSTETDKQYIVEVSDNGIGMDEYIIRNYLTVAGKSYYQSEDFKKMGITMDPISKFGIGVLSCFMVADKIDIETYRDPAASSKNNSLLKISIPSKEHYFRIEKCDPKRTKPGTKFTVYVDKDKLPKIEDETIKLEVTQYIKVNTGFLKYPIRIDEDGKKTLIPSVCDNIIPEKDEEKYEADYTYPIDEIFLPQCVRKAKEYFVQKTLSLKEDLNLTGYDGYISFLQLKNKEFDLQRTAESGLFLFDTKNRQQLDVKIRFGDSSWDSYRRHSRLLRNHEPQIRVTSKKCRVFNKSIYLPDIYVPDPRTRKRRYSINTTVAVPLLVTNIPAMKSINISRTDLHSDIKWDAPIWDALAKYIKDKYSEEIDQPDLNRRLRSWAQIAFDYSISQSFFIDKIIGDIKALPLLFLSPKGEFVLKELKSIGQEPLRLLANKAAAAERLNAFKALFNYKGNDCNILKKWRGSTVVIRGSEYGISTDYAKLRSIIYFLGYIINNYYRVHSVEFVSSPAGDGYPLLVNVMEYKEQKEVNEDEFLSKDNYDWDDNDTLLTLNSVGLTSSLTLVRFPSPYKDKAFYSNTHANIDHPFVRFLMHFLLLRKKIKNIKTISEETRGIINDKINDSMFFEEYSSYDFDQINSNIHDLVSYLIKSKIPFVDLDENNIPQLGKDDFVINSISIFTNKKEMEYFNFNSSTFSEHMKGENEWGLPLK